MVTFPLPDARLIRLLRSSCGMELLVLLLVLLLVMLGMSVCRSLGSGVVMLASVVEGTTPVS
jgi:hypothetical protein